MSKEWLEDIKERFVKYQTDYNLNGEDVEWLIKQAERVQSLEYYKKDWMLVAEQNKCYREALEFYAGGNHYSDRLYDYKIVLLDDGKTARKALEGDDNDR